MPSCNVWSATDPASYLLAELDKLTDTAQRRRALVDKIVTAADKRVTLLPVAERVLLQGGVAARAGRSCASCVAPWAYTKPRWRTRRT